MIIIGHSP